MFRYRLFSVLKSVLGFGINRRTVFTKTRNVTPVTLGITTAVFCDGNDARMPWDEDCLEHDFLIRQATTVNVNAATQLLTVTLVAIQDTSERLREALSKEICLIRQALEWGDEGTSPQHWDELVAIRGSLCDLNHNLRTLLVNVPSTIFKVLSFHVAYPWDTLYTVPYHKNAESIYFLIAKTCDGYMDYAEKLATVAAEISYLSGNTAASDAICERIDHACRTCNTQKQLTHNLQQESLEIQQQAIISSPHLEETLKKDKTSEKVSKTSEKVSKTSEKVSKISEKVSKTEVQPP